jgi:hypothetical protein
MELKTTLILLLAIFASLTNNQAANIPINYLPFKITAPGTYVMNTDLIAPYSKTPAITSNQPVGVVVIDLQGHTLHAAPVPFKILNATSIGIHLNVDGGAAGGIILQNGTLEGFAIGLETDADPDKPGDDVVSNITFKNDSTSPANSIAIHLFQTSGVSIVGCHFVGAWRVGIFDEQSELGNSYSNLHFDGTLTTNIQVNGHTTGTYLYPQIVNFNSTWNFPFNL